MLDVFLENTGNLSKSEQNNFMLDMVKKERYVDKINNENFDNGGCFIEKLQELAMKGKLVPFESIEENELSEMSQYLHIPDSILSEIFSVSKSTVNKRRMELNIYCDARGFYKTFVNCKLIDIDHLIEALSV